jgi:arabinan endo-1,5-alpha-L-arabinosidase
MKAFFIPAALSIFLQIQTLDTASAGQTAILSDTAGKEYPIDISKIRVRDPFILADKKTMTYYLVVNSLPSFRMYSSKDLQNWKDEGNCFTADANFWGKKDFWAPDLIEHKGKYYIWATFSGTNGKRGTSILVADKPTGPYAPLVNSSLTPPTWMALDGTLYIDEKKRPWMLYCHEWLEVKDGEIVAQQLSDDFKKTIGGPKVLFKASEGPWVGPIGSGDNSGYVTDAPFVYKTKSGEMLMLWSSFAKSGKYAIGVARSATGDLLGPWKQDAETLNEDDGGHAMIFKDFKGRLKISYHAPNSKVERPVIYDLKDENGKLSILK